MSVALAAVLSFLIAAAATWAVFFLLLLLTTVGDVRESAVLASGITGAFAAIAVLGWGAVTLVSLILSAVHP